jgi:DNA-binding LytR/AlgR family response regulator
MKIRCIAIDDEPPALDLMCEYINRTPFLELVGKSNSASKAFDRLEEWAPDLIFLDIEMADLSGIHFSRLLPKGPKIIFTTAYDHYAIEGYKVEAIDYLLKPIGYDEFLEAAQKGREYFRLVRSSSRDGPQAGQNYLFVNSEYKLIKVDFDDILYIEGLKDYVKFHLKSSPRPLLSLTSLKRLEEELPASSFMRVHRSYIVNLSHIRSIERKIIYSSFILIS